MTETKSQKSKQNNAQGKIFEKMILAGCKEYRQKGIAEIEKTPEPFSVVKLLGKGKFTGQFHKNQKAQPDFQGTLNNGRSIAFEAKCTTDIQIKKSVISKAQQEYLQYHTELGAYTGVCVLVNKTCGFIPWIIWTNMKEFYGRQYMTEEEVENFAVETFGHIRFLNFLDKETFYGYEKFGGAETC